MAPKPLRDLQTSSSPLLLPLPSSYPADFAVPSLPEAQKEHQSHATAAPLAWNSVTGFVAWLPLPHHAGLSSNVTFPAVLPWYH